MAEMKRINVTIWDYLDKDIQELNRKNVNVSKICRTALNREVNAKKLSSSNLDTWGQAVDAADNLCFEHKFYKGHDIAKTHVKNKTLSQSEMYYLYAEYQQFLDTGFSRACWYNLCKNDAISASLAQKMFEAAGQEESGEVDVMIDNINKYFLDIFKKEAQQGDEGGSFDITTCYDENIDWLEGYYCFVHRFYCYMLAGYEGKHNSLVDQLLD